MISPSTRSWQQRLFFYSIALICVSYGLFQYCYIPYSTIAADEFVFARHIYEYTFHLPYVDFLPYKSTIGHYILTVPFLFHLDNLTTIFYMKYEIAAINIIMIAATAYLSAKLFDKYAITIALLAIITNQAFIIHSNELRVDMLSAWFCLLATLYFLQSKPRLAGCLIGIAFLISQKALWYIAAIDAGFAICWLAFDKFQFNIKSMIHFNLYLGGTVLAYLVFWSCIAGPRIILINFFYDAYVQATIEMFSSSYPIFWSYVLSLGPFLFFLWPISTFCLLIQSSDTNTLQRQVFVAAITSISIMLFMHYKQPFPYNFVFIAPALYLLYAEFFTWLLSQHEQPQLKSKWHQFTLPLFAVLFSALLVLLTLHLSTLSYIDLLSGLIPLSLMIYLINPSRYPALKKISIAIIIVAFSIIAIALPYARLIKTTSAINGKYQQINLQLASELLKEGGTYLSGVPYLYATEQSISGLKNLITPQLRYLSTPTEEIKPLLLESLYLAPTTMNGALKQLQSAPVKFFINNYRIMSLPVPLRQFILSHYQHYYGSIYLYAPKVAAGMQPLYIKFSAYYLLAGRDKAFINLDGKIHKTNTYVYLTAGKHISSSLTAYRLVLTPKKLSLTLPEKFSDDKWIDMVKPIIY